jgi:hypothetical protein
MRIRLNDYPQLQFIAWNRHKDDSIEEEEAFSLYERNWRWVEQANLSANERRLIERLTQVFGHGVLNV